MASRSITEIFVLMRNNAMRNRHIYSEQFNDDSRALVEDIDEDIEMGRIPPDWLTSVEETQYNIVKLKSKLVILSEIQKKVISRPTLDESGEEDEKQIDALSHEISKAFNSSHRLVSSIKTEGSRSNASKSHRATNREKELLESVLSALASSLQALSEEFRDIQNDYLRKVKSREERSKALLGGVDCIEERDEAIKSTLMEDLDWLGGGRGGSGFEGSGYHPDGDEGGQGGGGVVQAQILAKNVLVQTREKEIKSVLDSIVDLNVMFKDLSRLVVDQGTILDRIDYNVERTMLRVEEGRRELEKADLSHRKGGSRKMICVIVLASLTTVLTALLIIIKT